MKASGWVHRLVRPCENDAVTKRIGNAVRPGKAGQASLATVSAMGPAKRRPASVWAMRHAAPKPRTFPDAQGAE